MRQRGARSRGALLIPVAFAVGGILLSLIAYSQAAARTAARLEEDFRFDAYQRTELVRRVFEECQGAFETLVRYFEGSNEVTGAELAVFVDPWLESRDGSANIFEGCAWLGRDDAALLSGGALTPAKARALSSSGGMFAGIASSPGALRALGSAAAAAASARGETSVALFSDDDDGEFHVALAAWLSRQKGCILAVASIEKTIERAIGPSPPVGLPTAVYDLGGERDLIVFHQPRLDALQGRPVLAPDREAALWAETPLAFCGRSFKVRVEASPAFQARRRTVMPAMILALGASLSVVAAILVGRLVSRRARAEAAAEASGRELARYFALGRDLFCIADAKGRIRRVNAEWSRSLGYPFGGLEGRPFLSLVARDDRAATRRAMRELVADGVLEGFSHRLVTASGAYRWLEWRAAADPRSRLAYAAARDVTERVETEAALTASLREKEILIREIHHRVKNNMQVVSSLVSLESRAALADKDPWGALRVQGLIRAMSMVHEAVYCSPGLDEVRMEPYIRDLVAAEASVAPYDGLRVGFSLGDATLDLERATLCGLAADELVAASIRRAGSAPEAGLEPELVVEGGPGPGGGFRLAVRGNGALEAPEEGIGLSIVEALVAQMGGRFLVEEGGAEMLIPTADASRGP